MIFECAACDVDSLVTCVFSNDVICVHVKPPPVDREISREPLSPQQSGQFPVDVCIL